MYYSMNKEKSQPGGMRTAWVEIMLAFVLSCLLLGLKHQFEVNIIDEGLALYGSLRVAHGEVPYRDYWTMYAPASDYLNAFAFHIFGISVGLVRKIWVVLAAIVAVDVFILGRLLGGRIAGWLAYALAVAQTIAAATHSGYSAVPAMAAALTGLILFGFNKPIFLVGLLAGLTAVFRPDFGLYVSAAIAAGLSIRTIAGRQKLVPDLFRFFAGACLIAVPVYGAVAFAAGPGPMIDQLLVYPLTVLPRYAYLPLTFPVIGHWWQWETWAIIRELHKLSLLFSLAILLVTLIALVLTLVRHRQPFENHTLPLTTALSLLALGLFSYALFRLDVKHVWPMMISMIPLIAKPPFAIAQVIPRVMSVVPLVSILTVNGYLALQVLRWKVEEPAIALASPRASGISIPTSHSFYNDLIEAIRSQTKPGEPIFSGAIRHDRIAANDVLLYFLTDRPAPIPYHELNRGLITTERVQKEVIRAIESRHVRVVVLLNLEPEEPNESSVSSGVTLLDEYIRTHFEPIETFGSYKLLRRR